MSRNDISKRRRKIDSVTGAGRNINATLFMSLPEGKSWQVYLWVAVGKIMVPPKDVMAASPGLVSILGLYRGD